MKAAAAVDGIPSCTINAPPPAYHPPPPLQQFSVRDATLGLPSYGGPSVDSIYLCRLFLTTLETSPTFTLGAVQRLRSFAKQRHVYGSKYGFPGGSAWCTMLWSFCQWLDEGLRQHCGVNDDEKPSPEDVLGRFLTVLALWPWPLPWTVENMTCIVDRKQVDGSAVEVSMGRHLSTAFVVPLPSSSGYRVWNMTQCVHHTNQQVILREAWTAATSRNTEFVNFRNEMREMCYLRHTVHGMVLMRWPVYLSVRLPDCSPPEWLGIVGSRLMSVLLPQLQACGFFPRPLCVDNPSYLVLLWPMDSVRTNVSHVDVALPLQDRILPCLFAMLEAAYITLWSKGTILDAPPLNRLLPELDVHLCDL